MNPPEDLRALLGSFPGGQRPFGTVGVPVRPPVVSSARRLAVDINQLPATGAWLEGDPPAGRHFVNIGALPLESGAVLPDVTMAYEQWCPPGEPVGTILVLHALTGDAHVTGEAGPGQPTAGWWPGMVGPGLTIDTDRYRVIAPNILGGCQGSTGPASPSPDGKPWGSRFPLLTTRDQVAAEVALTRALGIDHYDLVVGASMGGHRVLEWALTVPEMVGSIAVLASGAATTAEQIAWASAQDEAIRADPAWAGGDYYEGGAGGGPARGLALARKIAHVTYRCPSELDARFGRIPQHDQDPMTGGRFAVESYLEHHGAKLAQRFDANSYLVLTHAMITHDLGRDRGGVETALRRIDCPVLAVAVDSDRLFFPELTEQIAALCPRAHPVKYIHSASGHDGFLVENDQLAPILAGFLRHTDPRRNR